MRKINKKGPIPTFIAFKRQNPQSNWIDDFSHPQGVGYQIYKDTRFTILVGEQDCLDGYTEIPIDDERDCHLDHYRKRSMFSKKTFDWDNLIAATYDNDFGANYKDNRSGISRADYNLFFDPVNDPVHHYFYYNERGEIEPKTGLENNLKQKVLKTIEVFNLQNKSLVHRRKTVIDQVKSCCSLSKNEIMDAMKFGGFISVVEQYLNN